MNNKPGETTTDNSSLTTLKTQNRTRLFIKPYTGKKERIKIIKNSEGKYNTLVFSLEEKLNANNEYIKMAKHYGFYMEAGGFDLSLLMPRRFFIFHNKLFRMEQGRRRKEHHFCPTNPKTTSIISKQAQKLFSRSMQILSSPRVFHLFPDEGRESSWCSCPACRAFTPVEQNIIAVNCAADALAKLDSEALLSFFINDTAQYSGGVMPRKNMFSLQLFPPA